jgi:hypothetical protein
MQNDQATEEKGGAYFLFPNAFLQEPVLLSALLSQANK